MNGAAMKLPIVKAAGKDLSFFFASNDGEATVSTVQGRTRASAEAEWRRELALIESGEGNVK